MKKEFKKTSDFEKIKRFELTCDEQKKLKGSNGRWEYIDGEWVWIDEWK